MFSEKDVVTAALRRSITGDVNGLNWWHHQHLALNTSVRAALRDRGVEALPVILAELQQMIDKNVWHAVYSADLSEAERLAIIRSSMFLKDKYLASGEFDKYKARLVAGGDQQDKDLYEDISSPTAMTTSVLTVAAIAAAEFRRVMTIDIGGAYLNAKMRGGIKVHMRLDKIMSMLLCQLDGSYKPFLRKDGTLIVELDRALYGCLEAAKLWYDDLREKLLGWEFNENLYDVCVFNRTVDDVQITVVLHVDDLLITSLSQNLMDQFESYLRSVYPEIKMTSGLVIDYLGMTFDFSKPGQVNITMDNCVTDILVSSGVTTAKATPATSSLFETRDAPKATAAASAFFHTHVAKIQYLAKRVRPECLTAVSFLSTRVQCCDTDDLAKLDRLLGYIYGTRNRGIVLEST
jgi:hypothetical protein